MDNVASDNSDPFTLLGLPRGFNIDRAALQRSWLAASARLHPDRPDAPGDAAQRMARLNDAKAVLEDPERRANVLLQLLGGASKEQDKSLPEGFLAEMLDARERMEEEIEAEGDAARRRWEEWAGERRAEYAARVGGLFQRGSDPETLRAIRVELNAWRYIERLIEQIEPGSRIM